MERIRSWIEDEKIRQEEIAKQIQRGTLNLVYYQEQSFASLTLRGTGTIVAYVAKTSEITLRTMTKSGTVDNIRILLVRDLSPENIIKEIPGFFGSFYPNPQIKRYQLFEPKSEKPITKIEFTPISSE